mmetsp:Transcript_47425/g.133408  ORF Transcript_47425/g.133408 Transcript_47425/m.133408 type:complete len:139 (-) Transcript_47425:298-714(-)
MFSEVHRFLLQRHADIERMRAVHGRKTKLREETLAEVMRMLDHDTMERISQIQKFTDEVEGTTSRKIDMMQKQIAEIQETALLEAGAASPEAKRKMQFKLDRLGSEVEVVRSGLVMIADLAQIMAGDSCSDDDSSDNN